MTINPIKQTYTHSCLAVCLLMLKNSNHSQETEKKIWEKGSERNHDFYVTGIADEFCSLTKNKLRIIADNNYFTKILKKSSDKKNFHSVEHQKITMKLMSELLTHGAIICHIDNNLLGDYSHSSHFIVLEKELPNEKILIIDPWTGKKTRVSFQKLEASIASLKKHIKMCPLLIVIDD